MSQTEPHQTEPPLPFPPAPDDRTAHLLHFLILADRMKQIERRNYVGNTDRRENDAEHCFHMALCLLVLHKEVAFEADLGHALALVLVHDLVEIYAGDTFAYDPAAVAGQAEREQAAARRIFGEDLPADVGATFQTLWEEFEEKRTPESRLANACDRLQAFLQNYVTGGRPWRENGVTEAQTHGRTDFAAGVDPAFARLFAEIYRRAGTEGLWG